MFIFKINRNTIIVLSISILAIGILIHLHTFKIVSKLDNGIMQAKISFLLPVEIIKKSTQLTAQYPDHYPQWSVSQHDTRNIYLKIQENIPQGQTFTLKLVYKPLGLPIQLSLNKTLVNDVAPQLITPMSRVVPTDKPVEFKFNTFIDPNSFINSVDAEIAGDFVPEKWKIHQGNNYSHWYWKPQNPLAENQSFNIVIDENLQSINGTILSKKIVCKINTAVKPRLVSTNISDNSINVNLYPEIKVSYNIELDHAKAILKQKNSDDIIDINILVNENTAILRPNYVLLPDTEYSLSIQGISKSQEPSEWWNISFNTLAMADKYWLSVKLGDIHTLTVYKGKFPVRLMLASGGRLGHETPLGTYYTGDRGSSFWAHRFGEGATYWVRIVGNILIHSVPKDSSWNTKEEEHAKLGLPASHGCIRLSEPDAKWVYENIPNNTMIIIYQ